MKRIAFLMMFILFSLLIGCSADEKKIVIMEDLNNPSREEIRAKTQIQPNDSYLLSNEVGLGATRKQFDQAYGQNVGDLEIARYEGEFMIVNFENHRAVNIQYQFPYKPGEKLSDKEIHSYLQERLPLDAVEIKRLNTNSNQEIIEYRSESLRKTIPSHSFRGTDPGNFVVTVYKSDRGVMNITVSVGGTNE
ncbi:hypothetical protein [Bacillus sp. B15-48]|uniref:hypothetical protein n=1 Tax=Bacillus sp. B15-48 TaxID=1548601 RepID=UPI00193F92D3|nr:hypothetical protein [Bacillus sp. B15-48]MBM4763269.1 hypothetical protein [Bacillus sp. B15-48]